MKIVDHSGNGSVCSRESCSKPAEADVYYDDDSSTIMCYGCVADETKKANEKVVAVIPWH